MTLFGDTRLPDRFWEKVSVEFDDRGCWLFGGALLDGYGVWRVAGKAPKAHRVAYTALVGKIPAGLQLDHLCRQRNCVNPAHLEPVTQRENILRGNGACAVHARKTHCINGHEFTPENTAAQYSGGRACRTCGNAAKARYKARVRALAGGER